MCYLISALVRQVVKGWNLAPFINRFTKNNELSIFIPGPGTVHSFSPSIWWLDGDITAGIFIDLINIPGRFSLIN